MQPLNNDMDELFRKAAENYPLKLGEGDWESLSGKLVSASSTASLKKEKKSGRAKYYIFISLSLLFLLMSTGRRFFEQAPDNSSKHNGITEPDVMKQPGNAKANNDKKAEYTAGKRISTHVKHPGEKNHTPEFIALNGSMPVNNINSINSISAQHFLLKDSLNISTHLHIPTDTIYANRKKDSSLVKRPKGLYVGLTAGPDFSEVRYQRINKVGYNAGFIFGYRLSNAWSIESGVLWSKKKYYSTGKYFSLSKIGASMPAGMEIMEVEGQSSLFEFPVKVKYDFLIKKRSNFFLATGVTTNVYVKEKNNYLTKLNGVMEQQTGLYDNLPSSWFSVINISTGYEHAFGKSYSIRFEPYIKVPLRKVGMGSMPVLSTGINVTVSNLFSGQ